MINLHELLNELSAQRPVFHSEADFQHALAWHIHTRHPDLRIRLEYRPSRIEQKTYVDIWLEDGDSTCAIELKYKTRALQVTVGDEPFNLLNQGAQDIARYDFCKDICRVESLAAAYPGLTGYAVFLTNDQTYWNVSRRENNYDDAFRIHEASRLINNLEWSEKASDGTTKGRDETLRLRSDYEMTWGGYSSVDGEKGTDFRALVVAISSQ